MQPRWASLSDVAAVVAVRQCLESERWRSGQEAVLGDGGAMNVSEEGGRILEAMEVRER